MELKFDPKAKCALRLRGKSVELSFQELASLRRHFPDETFLPKNKFKKIFELGILSPEQSLHKAKASSWRKFLIGKKLRKELYLNVDIPELSYGLEPTIAFYWRPEVVEFAGKLYEKIRDIVGLVCESAASLGKPFPKNATLQLLHRSVNDWLEQNPEYRTFMKWKYSQGKLDLRLQSPEKILDDSLEDRFLRFNLQLKAANLEFPISVKDLPAITGVIDFINGRKKSIADSALENAGVGNFLSALRALDAVTAEPVKIWRPKLPLGEMEMVVTHMGHASLIVDSGASRILIDPLLFANRGNFEKEPLSSAELGRVEAIFFTHHHLDHMETGSLLVLPHDIPVFVPKEGSNPLRARNKDWLMRMGFSDVREIAAHEEYKCESGLIITALPFFGEGSARVGFDGVCFLLRKNGNNILIHADASPDDEGKSLVSSGELKKIRERYGRISAIWGSWWQQQGFAFRLGPYALLSKGVKASEWLDLTESCYCSPEFIESLLEAAGAQSYISYAESGSECFLPRGEMSSTVPALSLLWQSMDGFRERLQSQGRDMVAAQPYLSYCVPQKGKPYFLDQEVAASRQFPKKASVKSRATKQLPGSCSVSE